MGQHHTSFDSRVDLRAYVKRSIAILEDNEERIAQMERVLADKFPFFDLRFFRTAPELITWLQQHAETVICLSLDHDLDPPSETPDCDPGTGRDVVDYLIGGEAAFPVIVHTTNGHAGLGMTSLLDEHHWIVQRVTPYEDLRWIAEAWLPLVRQSIVDAAEGAPRLANSSVMRSK
jgi:hypothetical protein